MNTLTRVLVALTFITSLMHPDAHAQGLPLQPDFAYPKTVMGNAEKVYRTSTGILRMQAAMQLATAQVAIDPDSAFSQPAFIAATAAGEKDGAVAGLLRLYEARLLADIYAMSPRKYDRVDAPAEPVPADVRLWSGEQFKSSVTTLTDSAVEALRPYYSEPLSKYNKVVQLAKGTASLYPTLLDFVAAAANTNCDYVGQTTNRYALMAMEAAPAGTMRRAVWQVCATPDNDELWNLYTADPHGTAAGYILYRIRHLSDDNGNLRLVTAIRKYLADNPANEMTPYLSDKLARLTQPRAEMQAPPTVIPGEALTVSVEHYYTSTVGVNVYHITNPKAASDKQVLVKTGTVTVDTDKEGIGSAQLQVTVDRAGHYALKAVVDGSENKSRWSAMQVQATGLAPFLISSDNERVAVIADARNGAPVGDASIALYNRRTGAKTMGRTGRDNGILRFRAPRLKDDSWRSYSLIATVGGAENYFDDITTYTAGDEDHYSISCQGQIYLDRPIYRPGETIGWSATIVSVDSEARTSTLCEGLKLHVELRDANYQVVDTLSAVTDAYGRACGKFVIPTDRLTGRYSISITQHNNRGCAQTSLMVSDYKAPVFEVTDLTATRRADGTVTISGRAVTYSGMAVADAAVKVGIREVPRWYWRWWAIPDDEPAMSVEGTTDAEGRFSIDVKTSGLDSDEDYQAAVRVTSAAAETADGNIGFTTGKPYILNGSVQGTTLCCDEPMRLPITAYGPDGKPAELPVRWTLSADSATVQSGTATIQPDGLILDQPELPAAVYTLRVEPTDTTLCDGLVPAGTLTIYSIKRNSLPASSALLLPVSELRAEPGTGAELTLGVGADEYVYIIGATADGLTEPRVVHLERGFHKLKLHMPEGADETYYTLLTARDGKQYAKEMRVRRPERPTLTMSFETMRDRLVPGSRENWRIRVSHTDGSPVDAAMIATMYNRALDALYSYSWPTWLPQFTPEISLRTDLLRTYGSSTQWSLNIRVPDRNLNILMPDFRYLPQPLHRMTLVRSRKMGVMEAEMDMADMAAPAPVLNEMIAVGSAQKLYGAAAGIAVSEQTEEAAEDSGAEERFADAPEVKLRSGFSAQALWMPEINVDADGSAVISFTLPEDNTTWAFHALGWNRELQTATLDRDFVASKPLMVQPNLPRFVRNGDIVTVLATVYNNTDSATVATTTVQFLDPVSGKTIGETVTHSDSIAAGASVRVAARVDVPVDASLIAYRVVTTAGGYSDGEQVAIPVLSSGATVIDTENFVLTPEKPTFETRLPKDKGSIMALQYCQNPVWDVVRALPYLLADRAPLSAPEAAQMVYGALTARGMSRQYPELARVIEMWRANPADSALVSDLSKNEDIKIALLGQTPWVQAAASNTERMARLTSVFDKGAIKSSLNMAMKSLGKLQGTDGGFRWGSWSDASSLWATEEVAWALGHLRMQGYLDEDSDAGRMAIKALGYCDRHVDSDDFSYALLLSFYPGYKPTTVKAGKAVSTSVNHIIKNWREASTAMKARYALVLEANGYHNVARQVMESVRQHEVTDAYGCISLPSVTSVYDYAFILHAFARIAPEPAELDGMRRWLVLRTQASDDLGTRFPTPVISAILSTGTAWTAIDNADSASLTVGGKPVDVDRVQYATGAISTRLGADDAGKTLRVSRGASGPVSYGSLTTVANRLMTEVKASGCPQLSISKRTLVQRDGQWVETDDLRLGEQARVQLIIRAEESLDYVTINDERAAALEPVDQLPGYVYDGTLGFYRENSDSRTRLFIGRLPKGTYHVSYDMTVAAEGVFSSGIATAQSQYAPEIVAHSGGTRLTVRP